MTPAFAMGWHLQPTIANLVTNRFATFVGRRPHHWAPLAVPAAAFARMFAMGWQHNLTA